MNIFPPIIKVITESAEKGFSNENYLTLFAALVAFVAVVVSPIVSLKIAKRQNEHSLELAQEQNALMLKQMQMAFSTANKQLIAPMRQEWINKLRTLFAEMSSRSQHCCYTAYQERKVEEIMAINTLKEQINYMLNPNEDEHQRMSALLEALFLELEKDRDDENSEFGAIHAEYFKLSRAILKEEWNRVKDTTRI